ncbi:MAG TPA: tail fiber protein [Pelobium sp.]|nr:tail fiber protein [Pelobium sp.]
MKRLYFTFLIASVFITTLNVNAQTNVTSSGMSIQGIARDESNAALANIDQLALVFKVYYLGTGNSEQTILTKTANVKTDNFGVFSYVLDIDQLQYNQISTHSAYLKVVQGSVVFSNEKLQAVPYAIYAQNGVPTGSIMPFIGTVAPNGWLLCDGSSFPDNANTASLKALLGGTTTPNLQGMFLRGTGTSETGHAGPALKTVQQDDIKSHLHSVNIKTNSAGNHNHNNGSFNRILVQNGQYTSNKTDNTSDEPNIHDSAIMKDAGEHTHNVVGNTGNTGTAETRPINYGVNYIIKI